MTWTTQLTYTADGLTEADTAALATTLTGADVAYTDGRLQIRLEVDANTLQDATDAALRVTSAATGLLKPTHLQVLPTDDFLGRGRAPFTLDLIGITEIAAEFGVTRQRAGKIAELPGFPAPVAHPASGRVYSRPAVQAFHQQWEANRTRQRPSRTHTTAAATKASTP
ncbi:hypothetical protein QRB38_19970 [Mycobacterium avium subsp. hominissuis]|uniref:hypothetical protein n=1 Tax=Mycobacterium avium TaxID=1764 RepID=UPI0026659C58|nr:hypothetical protein [Mycobacterium avium]MDO2396054.1 hypothetical protein [Mycobacterium avium subsp. hominissuis]